MPDNDEFFKELMDWKENKSPLRDYDSRKRQRSGDGGSAPEFDDIFAESTPDTPKKSAGNDAAGDTVQISLEDIMREYAPENSEPKPAPEAKPRAVPAPAPKPAAAEKPIIEPKPAEEVKPAVKPTPAAEQKPVEGEKASPPVFDDIVSDDDGEYTRVRRPESAAYGSGRNRRRDPLDTSDLPEELVGKRDFEMEFDCEKEYPSEEEKPLKRGRSKRTGCMSGILYFIFVIAVSVALAVIGWMCAVDVLGLGGTEETVELTLPKSIFTMQVIEEENDQGVKETKTVNAADMDYVSEMLYNNGLIKYKWLFKLYAAFAHADTKVAAGTWTVKRNYDYRALVNGMTASGGRKVEIEITIPEGYRIDQIVKTLVENKVCEEAELWEALANYDFDYDFLDKSTIGDRYRLEGYLFPDTYLFYIADKPVRVVNKMLADFSNRWKDEYSAEAQELGYSMREILTVASLIEREAGSNDERATIASVIYNRLDNPDARTAGFLQIDAAVLYGMYRGGVTGDINVEYDSPYNTYMYKGLPPGPIASPGLASIKAALKPANTKYFYYALGKEGTHEFFKKYEDFAAFVNSDAYGG